MDYFEHGRFQSNTIATITKAATAHSYTDIVEANENLCTKHVELTDVHFPNVSLWFGSIYFEKNERNTFHLHGRLCNRTHNCHGTESFCAWLAVRRFVWKSLFSAVFFSLIFAMNMWPANEIHFDHFNSINFFSYRIVITICCVMPLFPFFLSLFACFLRSKLETN